MLRGVPTASLVLVLATACGADPQGSPRPASPAPPLPSEPPPAAVDGDHFGAFPTLADLESLAAGPRGERRVEALLPVVEPVDVIGPLPNRIGLATLRADNDPFDPILGDAIGRGAVAISQTVALDCVARELGHYVGRTGQQPDMTLRRFAAQACGAATSNIAIRGHFFSGGRRLTPEKAAARFGGSLQTLASTPLFSIEHQIGGWLGRVGDRWTVMLAAAPMPLALDPGDRRAAADGSVRLTGRLFDDVERLSVQITHGTFGTAQCAVDPEVELPRFAIDCPTDRRDAVATISIGGFEKGRLLGRMIGAVQVWPQKRGPTRFEPVLDGSPLPADPARWGPAVVETINGRREALGLEPVAYDAAQSASIAALTVPFDDAVHGVGDLDTADRIAMGVMAGWQVGGHVLEGGFAAGRISGPKTAQRLLADLLWLPDGRRVVFDVRATRLAVGAGALPGASAAAPVGVLLGAYRTLEEGWRFDLAREDADAAFVALTRARAVRGRSAPIRQPAIEQAHVPLSGAELSGPRVSTALGELMRSTTEQTGRQSAGVALRTTRIDGVLFPEPILEIEPLEVAVIVGYGTKDAGPWPPRVVLMSYPR